MKRPVLLFALLTMAGCGNQQSESAEAAPPAGVDRLALVADRFTPSSVEKAKKLLRAEPKVIDLNFNPINAIEWHVAVQNDGTKRHGYAEYLCLLLRDADAYDDEVAIRIVDASKVASLKDAYQEHSLGAVRCSDGQLLP